MRSRSRAAADGGTVTTPSPSRALQIGSVLKTAKAAEVSVAVARAFVAMRTQLHALEDLPATIAEIQSKLDQLEAGDADLNAKVEAMAEGFKAIRQALRALNQAQKQVPQLEKGRSRQPRAR